MQWGVPIVPTRACPLSQGMQSFGGAAAGDGLMGAKAELEPSYVFHGKFANVPEQGEVPKQITMQDAAHPSPPSCPQLVLGHLPCLRGREGGQEGSAPRGELSHSTTSWICVLVVSSQPCPDTVFSCCRSQMRAAQPLCTGWAGKKD